MQEIRFHGRGGQGAVTAAELFAQAAIAGGLFAQAFPNFGAERRGAPVMAFLRVADSRIYLRERIEKPDVVVVLDPSLAGLAEVTRGLAPGKTLLINAAGQERQAMEKLFGQYRVAMVDASRIALETIGLPITNTAIVGALVKATDLISRESLQDPFEARFGRLAGKNLEAMSTAYEQTVFLEYAPQEEAVVPEGEDYREYIRGEALHAWQDVEIGCDVHIPGNSRDFLTGNWRTGRRPQMDAEKCIHCGICWVVCPEMAFCKNEESYAWSGDYCKGCGICVTTCPKKALTMEDEK